ncbi:molybdenum cofactor guanylyltransferase [Reyranella aquatilis]|jgi:molybdopterin-guanine dinucleotide biosynthesis protein A|uniref:Molybdenum cofactor guanylyltransferase n=1 Tax=Reyranella aquatilis TaxID=2035356 RepID=A0ABS8L0I9_9HYPH|nr:molybdenum cofactor guanylyltransferase MobA [Reyranella aquatilis]MCC8431861.1 molybdenum cofactor guanylyltransferase [Reyranella aquatilis]
MAAKALQNLGPVRSGAVVGVILAGGEGRRMGPGPLKPLRPLAGKPMIAHVVERLRPQVMDLVIVANDPDPAFEALQVPVVADAPDIQAAAQLEGRRLGPLAGILAGMEWSLKHHPHAGWILTAPADVPFLPLDLTVRLCGLMHVPEPDVLMVRHGKRREHTLAIWSVKLAADLRRAILEEGMRRVETFAQRYVFEELVWPGNAAPFLNVNTPTELSEAMRRLERARSRSRR